MSNITIPSYQLALKELKANLSQMLPANSLKVFNDDAIQLEQSITNILKVKPGDKAPDFTLNNAIGDSVNLYDFLKKHRVVLMFYRGSWCPYCKLAINHYQAALSEIENLGAKLIAISAQTPDESLSIKEKHNLKFEVLSDNGNLVASLYTTVFKNDKKALTEMKNLGYDFDSFYGNDSKEIPVPAVFIIEQNGAISFAKTEGGDYRNRTEAKEIINQLSK